MSKADYNKRNLIEACHRVGIQTGDTIYCHVSLGRLGRLEEGFALPIICETLNQALREAVGNSGTILIPTYSYSIGKNEVFDVENTPSVIGPFTEYFRTCAVARRSREPMLAVSGIGPGADDLFRGLPPTTYGEDSLFDRLALAGAKICCLGLGIYCATFLHYIERVVKVPWRFYKYFNGIIRSHGKDEVVRWEHFCAPRIDNCAPNGPRLQAWLEERGVVSKAPVGRGLLSAVRADVYLTEGTAALNRDPWLTAKGPPCPIERFE